MSRALQALVGLASVAQPTAATAAQEITFNRNIISVSAHAEPGDATNFVATTILGTGENPTSNPFALIGLTSAFEMGTNQTRFYIDYKIRSVFHANLDHGLINSWRESKVTIKNGPLSAVSPLDDDPLYLSRMGNINSEISGGVSFAQAVSKDSVNKTFENGEYTFRYALPYVAAFPSDTVVSNEIAALVPYNADNIFTITFSDTFWPGGGPRANAIQYETTIYYNPTLDRMYDGPNGTDSPVTNWISRVIAPKSVPDTY